MSQEFVLDGDHEEMVANWIAESDECDDCYGNGCERCEGLGRIAVVRPAQVGPFDFKSWFERNQTTLAATFRQLNEEGGGPPDFFEWVAVQHEVEMIRATVPVC